MPKITLLIILFIIPTLHADEIANVINTLPNQSQIQNSTSPLIADCLEKDPFDGVVQLSTIKAPEKQTLRPFHQNRPRENTCLKSRYTAAADNTDAGFKTFSTFPCKGGNEEIYSGVAIDGADYHDLQFLSLDGSKAETYIYLTEAVLPQDSYNVKSMMFLLPRKGTPVAEAIGEEIHVTLQTGEVVIYDRKTKKIKGGALLEGPSDPSKDRFTRKPPNIHYNGSGISIRVDHRYEHPSSAAGDATAEIKQGNRKCSVAREKLWDKTGEILELDDNKLVNLLNQLCPLKKGETPFST